MNKVPTNMKDHPWGDGVPNDLPCRDMTRHFYNEDSGHGKREGDRVARALCAGCSYKEPCLEYLLMHQFQHGYGASMTAGQRRKEIRRRRRIEREKREVA